MTPVVYIAGPMTGIEGYNRPAFNAAERELKAAGLTVINPAVLPLDLPESAYMPICLEMLKQCNMMYMLDGWRDSSGAMIEFAYGVGAQMPIFYQSDGLDSIEALKRIAGRQVC